MVFVSWIKKLLLIPTDHDWVLGYYYFTQQCKLIDFEKAFHI